MHSVMQILLITQTWNLCWRSKERQADEELYLFWNVLFTIASKTRRSPTTDGPQNLNILTDFRTGYEQHRRLKKKARETERKIHSPVKESSLLSLNRVVIRATRFIQPRRSLHYTNLFHNPHVQLQEHIIQASNTINNAT